MLMARGTTQTTERLARMPGSNDRGTAVGFRNNLNLKTVGVPYSIVSSKNRNVVGGLFDTLLGCSWWRFGLVLGSAIVICQSGARCQKWLQIFSTGTSQMLGRYNVGVVQIVRRRIQALMLPEDTLKHYFNYRETPAPNTKHQSPITKRFEFDSGADFFLGIQK